MSTATIVHVSLLWQSVASPPSLNPLPGVVFSWFNAFRKWNRLQVRDEFKENAQSQLMAIPKVNFAATYTFRKESVQCYSRSRRFSTSRTRENVRRDNWQKNTVKELGIPWNVWKVTNHFEHADNFHSSRLVQVIMAKCRVTHVRQPLPAVGISWFIAFS